MKFPFFVVTATQCGDCGGEQTAKVFQQQPTEEEIDTVGCGSICEIIKITKIENLDESFEEIDT